MGYSPHHSIEKTNLILDLISKKQQAHGVNITNVNTPNYQKRGVDFAKHLGLSNSPLETKLSVKFGASPVMKDQGGPVHIPEELIAMQQNSILYSLATRRMSALIQEMKQIAQVGK